MTNWRTYMSMICFMGAGVVALNIKDNYSSEKMTPVLAYLFIAFALTIGIGLALIISVLMTRKTSQEGY